MAVTPKAWQDSPSTATPINAAALIDLETRILADYRAVDYGATADCRTITDLNTTSGSTTVTSATAAFTPADVGKTIVIGGGPGSHAISAYTSSTTVTIVTAPTFTIGGGGTNASIGTDNTTAIRNAYTAAATAHGGTVILPAGRILITGRLQFPVGVNLKGPGSEVCILDAQGIGDIGGQGDTVCAFWGSGTGAYSIEGFQIIGIAPASIASNDHCFGLGWAIFDAGTQPVATQSTLDSVGISIANTRAYVRDVWVRSHGIGIVIITVTNALIAQCRTDNPANCGLVIAGSPGSDTGVDSIQVTGGYYGLAGRSTYANAAHSANIKICGSGGDGDATPNARLVHIYGVEVDELPLNAGSTANQNIYIDYCYDVVLENLVIYPAGPASYGTYIGIHVAAHANRVTLRDLALYPFTVDSTRVPTHTIQIDTGATDVLLDNIITDPNLSNGGGDISDSGTRTVYRNVRPNSGRAVNTEITKAGTPADGDWDVAPPIGTRVLDTTAGKIWYRTASATWKAATLT